MAEPAPAAVAASEAAAADAAAPPPAVASTAPAAPPLPRSPPRRPAAPQSVEVPAELLEASNVEPVTAPPTMPTPRVRLVIDGSQIVNLRAEASTSGTVLAMLLPGVILEEIASDGAGTVPGWRHVRWNGREGWVAASLVAVKPAPLSQVPVADQGIDFQHPGPARRLPAEGDLHGSADYRPGPSRVRGRQRFADRPGPAGKR